MLFLMHVIFKISFYLMIFFFEVIKEEDEIEHQKEFPFIISQNSPNPCARKFPQKQKIEI